MPHLLLGLSKARHSGIDRSIRTAGCGAELERAGRATPQLEIAPGIMGWIQGHAADFLRG